MYNQVIYCGLFLIAAAIWISYHSISFIATPHELPRSSTLWILLIVIAIKETLFRYVFSIGIKINSQAVKAAAHHHRSDANTSVAAFIVIKICWLKNLS